MNTEQEVAERVDESEKERATGERLKMAQNWKQSNSFRWNKKQSDGDRKYVDS